MTLHDLLQNFEALAEAPDALPRLRELVLQLAVRGKLVAQDPGDEPASVLLHRIAKEKAHAVKVGRAKKETPLPPVKEDERPFEVPEGWEWVRLGEVCSYIQRGKSPDYDDEGGSVPVISQKCVQWSGFKLERARFISDASVDKYGPERFLTSDDLLWNSTGLGTLGRVAVYEANPAYPRAVADSHVTIVRASQFSVQYLWCWLASPVVQERIETLATGSTKQTELATSTVSSYILPLPPLAEQHRIVAAVDALMAHLDALEAARSSREACRVAARDAALAALRDAAVAPPLPHPCSIRVPSVAKPAPPLPSPLQEAWHRVAAHMDDLFTSPSDIPPLRQTILQLAIRGQLVPQDPTDEPASELLKRIAAEKARGVKEGRLKKEAPLPPVGEDERPFEVPAGWVFVPLANALFEVFTGPFGSTLHASDYVPNGIPVLNPQNLRGGVIEVFSDTCISEETTKRLSGFRVRERDVILARRGEMGRCAVVGMREDGWLCGTGSLVLRPPSHLSPQFLALFIRCPFIVDRLAGDSVGSTMLNLNQRILCSLPLPLPPLAEQHRIVAAVDALLSLCDTLEARLKDTHEARAAFAAAAVHHLDA